MFRPTFLGFETAKRGLTAAQKGIDIAGQNLTNWDSAGYTRQRMGQVAIAPDSFRNRYSSNRVGLAGQGVDIQGIGQTRDKFLDKRFREESSDTGYFGQSSVLLNDIQASLNEFNPTNDTGLRSCIMSMSDALQKFSVNAFSETHANIVATEFKNMTQTLQQISAKLQNAREQQKYDLEVSVQDINKKLQQVAGLNQAIMEDMAAMRNNPYFGPNELMDERNLLLDELSEYINMEYSNNADGTVTVTVNGHEVVNGSKFDKMEMVNDQDTGVVSVRWISTNKPVELSSGAVKASLDHINGRGPNLKNPGESTSRGFLYYKDKLDAFALSMANTVNRVIPKYDAATGEPEKDANGNIVYRQLLASADGKPITADNLSISKQWSLDPGYIIYQRGDDQKPEDVSKYALALQQSITDGAHFFDSNGEEFNGTFLDYIKGYCSTLAEDVSFAENRHVATSTISHNLEDSRDQISGVVVDEEVTNVMMYQKSLTAASRLMTVMDEALDVIVNKMGLVGR